MHRVDPLQFYIDHPTVLTIGVFDGVHLGHRHLIGQAVARARELKSLAAALTFDPHPQVVLRPRAEPVYLTTVEEKLALLRDLGLDLRVLLHFDRSVAEMTAHQFVTLLCSHINLKELWVGPDFALGHHREGTLARLEAIGREVGFGVHSVPPFSIDGEVVSSTLIRHKLAAGDVRGAARLLGRFPRLTGKVVVGWKRGRTIGFPTANIDVGEHVVLPADGVYVTCAHLGHRTYDAVTNIGVRPSFDNGHRTIEAYLLDFNADIYGEVLSLEFRERLRGETRFDSVDGLINQINQDVEHARRILGPDGCR